MITDKDTNTVYVARQFSMYGDTVRLHHAEMLDVDYLWARDYMPIQIDVHCFVQYHYQPDYLIDTKAHRRLIPQNINKALKSVGILEDEIVDLDLIVDIP